MIKMLFVSDSHPDDSVQVEKVKTDNIISIENLWTDDNRMVWVIIEVMMASTLLLHQSSFFPDSDSFKRQ